MKFNDISIILLSRRPVLQTSFIVKLLMTSLLYLSMWSSGSVQLEVGRPCIPYWYKLYEIRWFFHLHSAQDEHFPIHSIFRSCRLSFEKVGMSTLPLTIRNVSNLNSLNFNLALSFSSFTPQKMIGDIDPGISLFGGGIHFKVTHLRFPPSPSLSVAQQPLSSLLWCFHLAVTLWFDRSCAVYCRWQDLT